MSIKFFTVFSNHPLNGWEICSKSVCSLLILMTTSSFLYLCYSSKRYINFFEFLKERTFYFINFSLLFSCFQFHGFQFLSISCLLVLTISGSSLSSLRKKYRLLTWELSFSLKINVFMVYLFISFYFQPTWLIGFEIIYPRTAYVGSFLKIYYINLSLDYLYLR